MVDEAVPFSKPRQVLTICNIMDMIFATFNQIQRLTKCSPEEGVDKGIIFI